MFSQENPVNRSAVDEINIRHTILIALVVLGGALLRLFMLTNQSLWYDEGLSLVATDSKTLSGTFDALAGRTGGDKYQPLYFFVLSAWRSVVGDSEFSLRALSVLPGIVALFFMYATVANSYGSRHAFWSTTYLTVSAFWICYSQEVRPYSLLFALAAIQLFLLSEIFSGSPAKKSRLALFAVATGVSCFASILLAVFTVALAVAHVTISQSVRGWLKWWVPAALACIPALVYLLGTPVVSGLTDSTNGLGIPLYKNSLFAIYGILVGHTYGPPLEALRESGNVLHGILQHAWALVAFAVACGVLFVGFLSAQNPFATEFRKEHGQAPGSKPTRFFLVTLLCSFCLAILVAKVSAINWMPRHSFYLSIPLAILLPLAFSGQPLRSSTDLSSNSTSITTRWFINRSAHVAFIWLLAMNLYASYNYFYKSEYWRDDYRSAAGYLATELNETDRAIMLWGEPRLLSYYGDPITQKYWSVDPSPVSTVMDGVHSDGGNVFVAINREFTWSRGLPTSDNLETQVAEKYNLISVKRYVNFNIYEFENISTTQNDTLVEDSANIQTM